VNNTDLSFIQHPLRALRVTGIASLAAKCLLIATCALNETCRGVEYEVKGRVNQAIYESKDNSNLTSASFTIFVRDSSWLIETIETNEAGSITEREIGASSDGILYECEQWIGRQTVQPMAANQTNRINPYVTPSPPLAFIWSNSVPVGKTDSAVAGHLWLMFASRSYWPSLKTDQLIPVFDWQASTAAGGQDIRVKASWNLIDGLGSLPKEVRYLGHWGETNATYKITGSKHVGGIEVPTGFEFEQLRLGPLNENTLSHEMVVAKHVDVTITEVNPNCSKQDLLPNPNSSTIVIDWRLESDIPNRPPSYRNPRGNRWPTLSESKILVSNQRAADLRNLATAKLTQDPKTATEQNQNRRFALILLIAMLIAPLIIYFFWRKPQRL
jgi:hypothetical protein